MYLTEPQKTALKKMLAERYLGPSRLFAYGEQIGWYVALNLNPQPLRETGTWRIQCGPVILSRPTMRGAIDGALDKIRKEYGDV